MNIAKYKMGLGYSCITGLTLCTGTLLGFPMGRPKIEIEATVEILNLKKELIGKYKARGTGKTVIAAYYGYSQTNAIRKAHADAIENALSNIRLQIEADA